MKWYAATFAGCSQPARVRKDGAQVVAIVGGVRLRMQARVAKTLFDLGKVLDTTAQDIASEEEAECW